MGTDGVGSVVLDMLLGFPAAGEPWWRDGTAPSALFDSLRAHDLWPALDNVGLAGGPLEAMTPDELGAWSADWNDRDEYRIAPASGGQTCLDLAPSREGLRVYYRFSAAEVQARATRLLDRIVAWLRAVRGSDIGGGVRVHRSHVVPDADYAPPVPAPMVRTWNVGTVLDAIDREAYAGEVAAQYFGDRHATIVEGEAELARVLAAAPPPGSARIDDGPLVVWKHVADLTDPVAVERARIAQQQWITRLVEVAPA